jgi:diguanylate cyclase (GGDEF)-like protein
VRAGLLVAFAVAVVAIAGAEAVWLAVPVALVAAAGCTTRAGTAAGALAVLGGALAASLLRSAAGAPSPVLVVAVGGASVAVLAVVRERLEREREALRNSALTDALTGIANRRSLLARADYEIVRHTRARRSFAVVMLDLDGFKALNDRFGHAAGDDLLCDVATALTHAMRGQDTVARLGGDEFCVLAPETDAAGTAQLAARVREAVAGVSAGLESVRASVGVALFPADGLNAAQLIHAADERLLAVKRDRPRGRAHRRAA